MVPVIPANFFAEIFVTKTVDSIPLIGNATLHFVERRAAQNTKGRSMNRLPWLMLMAFVVPVVVHAAEPMASGRLTAIGRVTLAVLKRNASARVRFRRATGVLE